MLLLERWLKKTQVCRIYFLNTLDLKKGNVMGSVRRKDEYGIPKRCAVREAWERKKWSDQLIDFYHETHREMDIPYRRKGSVKGYLDQNLSVICEWE